MTEQEIKELRDIQGFIEFCINESPTYSQGHCLANVGHDCGILLQNPGDGSSPRTSGYAKWLKG